MKNNIFIRATLAVALLCASLVTTAREWHINNKGGMPAHFSDINAAMASEEVVAGDTLYIGAGCTISSEQTISKAVTVIGTGWSYNDSPATNAIVNGNLIINVNSAKVIGLYVNGSIKPQAHYIVIERCRFNGITSHSAQVDCLKLYSNYITGSITGARKSGYYEYGYDDITKIFNRNWEIIGNIIKDVIKTVTYATIDNNIIVYNANNTFIQRNHYSVFKNNIIINTVNSQTIITSNINASFQNNVLSASSGYSGNVQLGTTDITTVFKCTGSVESGEYYSLKEESPAIGAGEGGIDCGAMAGIYKFVPYGRPRYIPVLKEASVPTTPTDGKVKVSLKIENQNE